jgi:hypothetical protein
MPYPPLRRVHYMARTSLEQQNVLPYYTPLNLPYVASTLIPETQRVSLNLSN